MEIFKKYLQVVGKFVIMENCIIVIVMRVFRKGVTNVITVLWMIIEPRLHFEFFTLFCNSLILEPITKSSSMVRKTPLFCSFSGNSQWIPLLISKFFTKT